MVSMAECKIVSVSLPRSGHNMLMQILRTYFQERFHYCEFYTYTIDDCCKTIPCVRQHGKEAIFIQKTHDFESQTPILAGQPYLVQVRHIVPQILSHFDFLVRTLPGSTARDSIDCFRSFALGGLRYYKSFFERWVYGTTAGNVKMVVYDRILSHPIDEIAGVARFVLGDGELDLSRLMGATDEAHVSPQNDIRRHRYYESEILRFVENEAIREIEFLGLPKML